MPPHRRSFCVAQATVNLELAVQKRRSGTLRRPRTRGLLELHLAAIHGDAPHCQWPLSASLACRAANTEKTAATTRSHRAA
jgi:hypothetical protein